MTKYLIVLNSLVLSVACSFASAAEVKVRTLDGAAKSGRLLRLSNQEVVIQSGSREEVFPSDRLDSVGVKESASPAKASVQVALTDGTLLCGEGYAVSGGKARVKTADGKEHQVPLKSVVTVRLREQNADLAKQWSEYVAEEATGDRLVVRRKANPDKGTTTDSLDVLEGIIGEVTDTTVSFTMEGDVIPVKRDRIDGLIYFRKAEAAVASPTCVVLDLDGSRWAARSIDMVASDMLMLEAVGGLKAELPLAHIRKVDFASANRRYLADLEPDSLVRETWLADAKSSAAFMPATGRTPEGPVMIGGTLHPQGMWMPAKSALIVKVPAGFTRFQAQVGIDDRVSATDGARLLVEADGKVLLDKVVSRDELLTDIDLDLASARRVRITVDFGGESFIGDQLVLSQAIFVK